MSETRNFMALDWVKGEIEDTLRAAREALEAYAESPDDTTLARQCLSRLHQVNGTLQMVELTGAATLATEMESLAQALMNRTVTAEEAAQEALMEGILQLPSHLNRVHRGAEDDPRLFALLVDRMRVARGEEPLTSRDDLEVDPEEVAAFVAGPGPAEVRKVRGNFQKAMLALIRGSRPADQLYPFLDRVFSRLAKLTPASPLRRTWALAAGVMELRAASGEAPGEVVPLLRALDSELKELAETPDAALATPPPDRLVEGLVAILETPSEHESERLTALRRSLIPTGEPVEAMPVGADDETIATVAAALHEELGSVRDRLDLFVRGSVSDLEGLASLGRDLQRIAGTLSVVGLEDLRATIATQAAWIRQQVEAEQLDDDAIMEVASAVLFVDSTLMSLAGIESDDGDGMPGSLSDAHSAVLREARASLESVKQSIVDFISSEWDHTHLQAVPGTLTMVKSVLVMVPLDRAATLVEACRVYVERELLAEGVVPEWQRLDHLADAITSIDYFLERMLEDRVIPDPRLLDIAEESIEELKSPASTPDLYATQVREPGDPNATLDATDAVAPTAPGLDDDASADESTAGTAEADLDLDLDLDDDPAGAAATDGAGAAASDDDFDLDLDAPESADASVDGSAGVASDGVASDGAAADADDAVAADAPSALSSPVEDDFDLGLPDDESTADARGDDVAPTGSDAGTADASGLDSDSDVDLDLDLDLDSEDEASTGASVPESDEAEREDAPSSLAAPVEDDFDLGLSEDDSTGDSTGDSNQYATDDVPGGDAAAIGAAGEDDFPLDLDLDADPDPDGGEPTGEAPSATEAASADDAPSSLSAPAEDDFDLGGADPEDDAGSALTAAPPPSTVDDDLVDDEIIEIFLEEVVEVTETLDGALPTWSANPADSGALAEIRRAWHTLKGSGRMVGASVLGEMAWSVENMLNRVIDGTIVASPAVVDLVERARAVVPELREAFAERRAPTIDVAPLMERADVLSSGGTADEMDDLPDLAPVIGAAPAAAATDDAGTGADAATPDLPTDDDLETADPASGAASADDEPSSLSAPTDDDFDLGGLDDTPDIGTTALDDAAPPSDGPAVDDADTAAPSAGGDLDEVPEIGTTAIEDAPSSLTAPTDDDFDLGDLEDLDDPVDDGADAKAVTADGGLLEIFQDEAAEHLDTVRAWVRGSRNAGIPRPLDDELRRALHTLKGSAGMAGFPSLSELAAPLENLVRTHLELNRPADGPLRDLLDRGVALFDAGLAHLRDTGTERVQDAAEQAFVADADARLAERRAELERDDADGRGANEIFRSEALDVLLEAQNIVEAWARGRAEARLGALRDELDAVSGRARAAGQARIADLAGALRTAHDRLGDVLPGELRPVLDRGHETLVGMLDNLAAGLEIQDASADVAALESVEPPAAPDEITEEITASVPFDGAPDADDDAITESVAGLDLDEEMVDIFFEEADEILETIEGALEQWTGGDDEGASELMRALHTLKGGARMAGLTGLGAQAHDLETWIGERRGTADGAFFDALRERTDTLAGQVAALRRGESVRYGAPQPEPAPAADVPEGGFEVSREDPEPIAEPPGEPDPDLDAGPDPAESFGASPVPDVTPAAGSAGTDIPAASATADAPTDDLTDTDPEILALFLEEAAELIEELDGAIGAWREAPDNEIHLEGLLRALHTLKGGARMANLAALGASTHDLETRLIDARGRGAFDASFLAGVQQEVDGLSARVAAIAAGGTDAVPEAGPPDADAEAPQSELPTADVETDDSLALPEVSELEDDAAASASMPVADADLPRPSVAPPPAQRDAPLRESSQELIRVSSDLLEHLVTLAGETAIMRGRVQQEISDFSGALEEMSSTLARMREQVRRLDSEAQEQVLSRQEAQERAERKGYEDFDPLEMDRYTQLQEFARTLNESATDVQDLRDTLVERLRTTDTLLVQQGRINTELQEGLMRTRMVPFARLLPRLKRIVRQVGRELGKPVDLKVENAEGELDRNILERMIPPLEHMLRNAVDHGLEKPEVRTERGKRPQGTITLRLAREGGDILIQVADDGGGINVAGVRAKAIERGLLEADAEPSEEEILSFIMSAGFSTAQSVTQISGRGVGMDVVASEVKQLGGSIAIASTLGEGTTFSVRLPFTVSVNRALMVSLGDDRYAVPLEGIEGIVRVSPMQLKRKYETGATDFSYAGRTYQLSYLGEWLGLEQLVREDVPSVPILMVRSGESARAVHVDSVTGSREIVVKSLGPQFAGVAGVVGATILGDGSVVVILDLPAMLRGATTMHLSGGEQAPRTTTTAPSAPKSEPRERARRLHVMVVDDSVTVRKVTSRLLERRGWKVTLAKDGVEAVATLSETKPDVMLLDIEMPRMDGFEVATHVRNDRVLGSLPIIMISSRTGDKHRERADSIGVNRFLGKPFQEAELLETIEDLTDA